jgi:hypothetical protein
MHGKKREKEKNGANERQAYRRTSSNQGGGSLRHTHGWEITLRMLAVHKSFATAIKGINLTWESCSE